MFIMNISWLNLLMKLGRPPWSRWLCEIDRLVVKWQLWNAELYFYIDVNYDFAITNFPLLSAIKVPEHIFVSSLKRSVLYQVDSIYEILITIDKLIVKGNTLFLMTLLKRKLFSECIVIIMTHRPKQSSIFDTFC